MVSSPPAPREHTFRSDIEGLRAIAVLAVVSFHYGIVGIKSGFVGVDIFFVISGYLITGLLTDELEASGRIELLRFYGRRVRRLLPAALLMSIVTLCCAAFIFSPLEQRWVASAGLAASLYASNMLFLQSTLGYFSPESASNPYLHTWSLAVEEQFYLVWPALLLLMWRIRRSRGLLAAVMFAGTLASLALCIRWTQTREPLAFYSLPTRAWEFGLGGIASLAPASWFKGRAPQAAALGWGGMLTLLLACAVPYNPSRFPGPDALLSVFATACVLFAGASGEARGPVALLKTRPFQWIGARSYSIYLWHWPILVCATADYQHPSLGMRGSLLLLTTLCAALSFSLVEQPIRQNRWLGARPWRSVSLGASLTLSGAACSIGASLIADRYSVLPVQKVIDEVTSERPAASGSGHGCLVYFTDPRALTCDFGVPTSKSTIVLIGDSHADEWSTPIVALAKRQGWRVVTYLKSSCSVADIPVYNMRLQRFSGECAQWRQQALAQIANMHPAAIVVGEFSASYIRGPLTGLGDNAVSLGTWSGGLRRSLQTLASSGSPLILLRDNPTPLRDMRACLSRADWHRLPASACDTSRSLALDDSIGAAERDLSASIRGVQYLDLSAQFCTESACPAMRDGLVIYRDGNHLTARYASHLAEALRSALVPLVAHSSSPAAAYTGTQGD